MSNEPTTPPIPDAHADLMRLLEPHLTLLECRLVPRADGRYDIVDIHDAPVIGYPIDDLIAFAHANGVRSPLSS